MDVPFSDNQVPLVVDLDGTLANTDLLYEGVILLVRKNPLYIFMCLFWLMKGKVNLKNKVFGIIQIKPELLPYNKDLLNFLQSEFNKKRKLILATASLQSVAIQVSRVWPVFHEVYGTTDKINLKGRNKLNILINRFGKGNFDYIGNSYSDLVIFASCRYSYLANPSHRLQIKTKRKSNLQYTWKSSKNSLSHYLRLIRAYQWVKNLLIFVPLITSHSFYTVKPLLQAVYAFISFSLVASAGYLINDLSDLNSDRSHPRKCSRPLASGKISIPSAVILLFILLTAGFYLASRLDPFFWAVLLFYFLTSSLYSAYFKRVVLYDVFILAILYSTRVIAGGIATGISLSFWLIAFSTFIFLSLAFVKRYSELMQVTDKEGLKSRGRDYLPGDLDLLKIMGVLSGFISVVVFSLYIDSPEVALIYKRPKLLWSTGLLFLFWISRIWLVTARGKMTDDPIIFTLKDLTSYIIFLLIGLVIVISV